MTESYAIGAEWIRTVEPAIEPLTIAEAKAQARITIPAEDSLFDGWIRAARHEAEKYLSRGLLTQTWKLVLDQFADVMSLPMAAPLQSATIAYYDTDGTLQTLATSYYAVNTTSRPGRIERKPQQSWPSIQGDKLGAIEITYVVGWTTAALVPDDIKQGMRMYIAYLECDREGLDGTAALSAARCLWSDRVFWKEPMC
jgi:uncharacterized phiE125 gp8 family phage protein